jgi:hypothetical protein
MVLHCRSILTQIAINGQSRAQVVEGALTAVAPVAFAPRSVVVRAPRIDRSALAAGTLQRAIFPPELMNIGVAAVDIEKLVQMGEDRHG